MHLFKLLLLIWCFWFPNLTNCNARKPRRLPDISQNINSSSTSSNIPTTSTEKPINLMNDTNKVLYDVDLLLEKLQEKNKIIAEDFLNENSTGYRVLSSPTPPILNDSKFAQFFQKLKKKLLNVYHICKNKLSGNKTQRSVNFQDYDEYGDHLGEYNEDEYFDTFSEAQDSLPDPDKKLSFESYDENWKQITRNVLDSDLELLKGLVEYFKSEHSVGAKRYEHGGNLSKICFILNGNYHQVNSADATTSYSPIATSSNAKTNSNMPSKLPEEPLPTIPLIDFAQTTQSPNNNGSSSVENISNILKYMAHSHHPVYLSGIPQKDLQVDMKKVQEQIDSVRFRSNDFLFQNDEDGSNETEADFPFIPAMLESNDESNSLKRDTRKVKNHKSEDFWFQNYDYSADDLPKKKKSKESEALFGRYQDQLEQSSPNNQKVDNPETKNLNQEEDYMSELNGLHLNPNQHSDVESFLNQMNDHPKPFTFDIEPLLQSKLSEIRSGTSSQDQKPEDLSPKKYFEFDSEKKKRELPKYQQEVEHIKNDLISEYKNNYINLYKNSIDSDKYKHQLDSMKRQKNDFLDQYYLLNDGRIELDNFLKNPPVDGNGRLINSKDLDLDLKLNKEFQDSEFERDLTFQNSRDQFENQVKPQKSAKKMRSFY